MNTVLQGTLSRANDLLARLEAGMAARVAGHLSDLESFVVELEKGLAPKPVEIEPAKSGATPA